MSFKISQAYFKKVLTDPLEVGIGALDANGVDFLIGTQTEHLTSGSTCSGRLAYIGRSQNQPVKLFDPSALPGTDVPLFFQGQNGHPKTNCIAVVRALLSLMWPLRSDTFVSTIGWPIDSYETFAFNLYDNVTTLQQLNEKTFIHFSAIAWTRCRPWNPAWYYMSTDSKKEYRRSCVTSADREHYKYKYIFGFDPQTALVPLRNYTTGDGVPSTPYTDCEDTEPAKQSIAAWILESALFAEETKEQNGGFSQKPNGLGRRNTMVGDDRVPDCSDACTKAKTYISDFQAESVGSHKFWPGDNRPVHASCNRDNTCRLHRAYLGCQADYPYAQFASVDDTYRGDKAGWLLSKLWGDVEPLMGMETLWAAVTSTALAEIAGSEVCTRLEDYIDDDASLVENPIVADALVPVLLAAWIQDEGEWVPQTYMEWAVGQTPNPDQLKDEPEETYWQYAKRCSGSSNGSLGDQQNGIIIQYDADNTVWGASSLNRNLVCVHRRDAKTWTWLNAEDKQIVLARWPHYATLSDSSTHDWKWGMTKAYGPHLGDWQTTEEIDDVLPSETVIERPICSIYIPFGNKKKFEPALTRLWTTARTSIKDTQIRHLMQTNEPTVMTLINAVNDRVPATVKGIFVRNNQAKVTQQFAYFFSRETKDGRLIKVFNDIGGFYV